MGAGGAGWNQPAPGGGSGSAGVRNRHVPSENMRHFPSKKVKIVTCGRMQPERHQGPARKPGWVLGVVYTELRTISGRVQVRRDHASVAESVGGNRLRWSSVLAVLLTTPPAAPEHPA